MGHTPVCLFRPAQQLAAALCLTLATAGAIAAEAKAMAADIAPGRHAWDGEQSPAALEAWVNGKLAQAQRDVQHLLAVKGPRSIANTLLPYDDALAAINDAQAQASVLYGVGATAELRDKAQALTQKAAGAQVALSLNQDVYRALSALPAPAAPGTQHYVERTLLEYRLAGVDRDAATRAKVAELQDRITARGLAYERAVHDDVRTVTVAKSSLGGLPPDYLATHSPDAGGNVRITSDPPDLYPVLDFASDAALRREVYLARFSVGYPANTEVLRELLAARAELAHLLGYQTWADYAMADQMMGSPAKLAEFLRQVEAAQRDASAREDAELLTFARERDPSLVAISVADRRYWKEQYRRAKLQFDSQAVRPYFPYAEVERGVIETASRLFRVQIRPVAGIRTWHPSVTTYDVYDGTTKLGTIYLDMHPRAGKDKWFSMRQLTLGTRGRQLPDAALVCNFPGGSPGDPGLMQYDDVVTFLHEFGHLMHGVIGNQHQLAGEGWISLESDFIEAPSQMLEEFFRDYGVLSSFARHYQTGAVLPEELYTRMARATAYGRGSDWQRQLTFTAMSLDYHTMDPATLDFDAVYRRDFERYNHVAFLPGDHFWASYTHLVGYSSNYYTYVFDKVIALDMFAQFAPTDLIGGPTGLRYRQQVLAPGGSKPAAELVRDFLGREPNLEAYRRWITAEFAGEVTASSPAR